MGPSRPDETRTVKALRRHAPLALGDQAAEDRKRVGAEGWHNCDPAPPACGIDAQPDLHCTKTGPATGKPIPFNQMAQTGKVDRAVADALKNAWNGFTPPQEAVDGVASLALGAPLSHIVEDFPAAAEGDLLPSRIYRTTSIPQDGIDAALRTPHQNVVQFFRGDRVITYDVNVRKPLRNRLIKEEFPGLNDEFNSGVDAALPATYNPKRDIWLFRGTNYVRYSVTEKKILQGPKSIGPARPGLQSTGFENGVDGASWAENDLIWFFRGHQYLWHRLSTESLTLGPRDIGTHWVGLRGTPFATGVDGAQLTGETDSQGRATSVWLFRDQQYIRYNPVTDQVLSGPWDINTGFPGIAPELAKSEPIGKPAHDGKITVRADSWRIIYNLFLHLTYRQGGTPKDEWCILKSSGTECPRNIPVGATDIRVQVFTSSASSEGDDPWGEEGRSQLRQEAERS
ncbi:hypothetical protein ACWEQC_35115 [Streptomyces shenzhenensis]